MGVWDAKRALKPRPDGACRTRLSPVGPELHQLHMRCVTLASISHPLSCEPRVRHVVPSSRRGPDLVVDMGHTHHESHLAWQQTEPRMASEAHALTCDRLFLVTGQKRQNLDPVGTRSHTTNSPAIPLISGKHLARVMFSPSALEPLSWHRDSVIVPQRCNLSRGHGQLYQETFLPHPGPPAMKLDACASPSIIVTCQSARCVLFLPQFNPGGQLYNHPTPPRGRLLCPYRRPVMPRWGLIPPGSFGVCFVHAGPLYLQFSSPKPSRAYHVMSGAVHIWRNSLPRHLSSRRV